MNTTDYYEKLAQEFKKSKEAIDMLTKRQNEMRAELIAAIQEGGQQDDKGHLWYKVGGIEMKYERRVSRTFDSMSAENWARSEQLWDALKKVIEVIDEDKLLALAWDDETIAETVQAFYSEKETWALKV